MNAFGALVVGLAIAIPIAWFASEYQHRRWLRLTLGCFAILLSFGIAAFVGSLERLSSNAWFGHASKDLVDATVAALEAGKEAEVIRSLKTLQQKFTPTYENRARYDILVNETVSQMRAAPQHSQ